MIKKVLSILLVALISGSMAAQEAVHERPQRTPEEEAVKQTTRLVRELGITLYRMHLKYARTRQRVMTRAQSMEKMQSFYADLKQLLTPDEYERFMNHPVEQPRRPHGANRMAPVSAPSVAVPNKPATPAKPQ